MDAQQSEAFNIGMRVRDDQSVELKLFIRLSLSKAAPILAAIAAKSERLGGTRG